MNFLSRENVLRHKEYLKELKLKYSVLEKSYPELSGLSFREIAKARVSLDKRLECLELKSKIILHELYFDSFCESFRPSPYVKELFGSEATFLYEIEREVSKSEEYGFLVVFSDRKNKLKFELLDDYTELLLNSTPHLTIDLYEHAYFLDYGFSRKKYVKAALAQLNLNKINDFYKSY